MQNTFGTLSIRDDVLVISRKMNFQRFAHIHNPELTVLSERKNYRGCSNVLGFNMTAPQWWLIYSTMLLDLINPEVPSLAIDALYPLC